MITPQIEIEDLIKILPESVEFMMNKGIRCLRCGEPIWGTLENAAIEKGFSYSDINSFVKELNSILESKSN
jgi:molybdenum-dependent DNA-binding transcriptional regulator ModE